MDVVEWNPATDKYLDTPYDETCPEVKGEYKAQPKILELDCQVVVLGTGKKKFEKLLENLEMEFPDKARGIVKFSVPLAHMLTAGGDFFIVPSRFEPCGLIQLHAMRYGTVPIVASTGGLVDTVKEGITGYHIGALDPDALVEEDVQAVAETVAFAAQKYGTAAFEEMRDACIKQD